MVAYEIDLMSALGWSGYKDGGYLKNQPDPTFWSNDNEPPPAWEFN